jgi:excisionase family DNA binding protein
MPRHYQRKTKLFPVALSPKGASDALDCSYDRKIRPAIASGELPAFKHGTLVRVLVSDLEKWVRTGVESQRGCKAAIRNKHIKSISYKDTLARFWGILSARLAPLNF